MPRVRLPRRVSPALGRGCYACMHHLRAAWWSSTFSINHKYHAVSSVGEKLPLHESKAFSPRKRKTSSLGIRCVIYICTLRVEVGWASRSFSLPCFWLAHILCQPSAPIHSLHWIRFSLAWKEINTQYGSGLIDGDFPFLLLRHAWPYTKLILWMASWSL